MGGIMDAIEYLGIPVSIACVIIAIYLVVQIVGEIIELCGKAVPEFFKIRKFFARKKQERKEAADTLKDVKQLLNDVNKHYNNDNITKRNDWMKGVDDRAVTCKMQMEDLKNALLQVSESLNMNTKMTEDMFVENSRDRIIDFAEKVSDPDYIVSHEQFRRIFRVHNDYENWLKEHNRTNGEVDTNYGIIQSAYAHRVNNHSFAEDLNKYK